MDDYKMTINGNNGDMGMDDFSDLTDPFMPDHMMSEQTEEPMLFYNSNLNSNYMQNQRMSQRSATQDNNVAENPSVTQNNNRERMLSQPLFHNGATENQQAVSNYDFERLPDTSLPMKDLTESQASKEDNGRERLTNPSLAENDSMGNQQTDPNYDFGRLPDTSLPTKDLTENQASKEDNGRERLRNPSLAEKNTMENQVTTPNNGPVELPILSWSNRDSMEEQPVVQKEEEEVSNSFLSENGDEGTEIPASPVIDPLSIPTPSLPSNQKGFSRVRALNGVANYGELALSVGDVVIGSSIPYGTSTQYSNVPDGFRVVTISTARFPRRMIFRQVIPFIANIGVTLAMVNTSNGIGIQVVQDIRCMNMSRQLACLRMVNLSYNSKPMDLALEDGRVIFSDVHFREITPFKRARPSRYNFVLLNSPNRPIPIVSDIVLINDLTYRFNGNWNALLQFSINMKVNTMYTVYIIGNDGYIPGLQSYILEN